MHSENGHDIACRAIKEIMKEMKFDLYPYGKPFNLTLGIQVLRPVNLRITVYDKETKRIYVDRNLQVKSSSKTSLRLAIVPDELTVEIIDRNLPRKKSAFRVADIKVTPDTKCPIDLSKEDKSFIRFAKWFATESSRLEAGQKGTLYQSEGFTILYIDIIKEAGLELTTPARIGRQSGIIEVSRKQTFDFTVPMLIVMLLHEYAHKFKNKEYGKKDSNELTADLIACHIALNLGFDSNEVQQAFKAVFAQKDTKLNRKRMAAIKEFIGIFKKQGCRLAS